MTPYERIEAAYGAWKDANLSPNAEALGRDYRDAGALHGLVGYLRAEARGGRLTPEGVAEAVEWVLRLESGAELAAGRTSESRPESSVDLRALGSCREGRRLGVWAG